MKKVFFKLVLIMLGFSAFAQHTDTLVTGYISIKNALVNSDGKLTAQAVNRFYQQLKSEQDFEQKEALLKATEKMLKAGDIEKQRAAFNDVSVLLWKTVKSRKPNQPLYYQYCPMKKAYWLSKEKEIKNPYYGSAMLSCGNVAETLQ